MVQCIGQIKVTSAAGKMSTDFNSEIQAELAEMGPEQQQRVLEFVRALRGGQGTLGTDLLAFAGTISKVIFARWRILSSKSVSRSI